MDDGSSEVVLAESRVILRVVNKVVLVGIAMLVLPGPAFRVFPLGLAILASEFLWARHWLKRARAMLPDGDKPPSQAGLSASERGEPEAATGLDPPEPVRRRR